ncbi:MAG: hypothetical protein EOP84_08905 [Verrucomicrobiaceae bacterium]|nr:MAG: hypothetical protein EOP84_08905 [Verrucomicrobiaceae bacterium]
MLTEYAWTQRITLNPAQVAGLSPEQLRRALSFEVEPFSGIPVADSVIGFTQNKDGAFTVVELSRIDHDAIQRAITTEGGTLAGITHPGTAPQDEEALKEWLTELLPRLNSGAVPLIAPPPPAPSPKRYLVAGIALEAAALLILTASATLTAVQKKSYERRQAELTNASRQLAAANQSIAALQTQLKSIDEGQAHRERLYARRGALYAALDGLARICPDDVILQEIKAEGPSTLLVSGLSLEAQAVDELSIVLTQNLRAAGWTAQPRKKTGKKTLISGGPWEFSLALTLDETKRVQPLQLSQTTP